MRSARRARLLASLAGAALVAAGAGCSQNCCTVDSYPITLARAPLGAPPLDGGLADAAPVPDGGALLAVAGLPGAAPDPSVKMVIDTGSPFTLLAGAAGANPQTTQLSWNLYGAEPSSPLRATFRGWDGFQVPLFPIGDPSDVPLGVLGADLLRNYSVEFRLGAPCASGGSAFCPTMTFWSHLDEDASLLEDAGYAVLNFTAFGGGEVTADGDPDFLGLRGPLTVPPTRVVLRGCLVPDPFTPTAGSPRLSLATCNNVQAAL
ncbi:MAG TPA: hypothetical protein VKZ18_03395, partial [Polyangia bacterium]|nr:hypothetical protein [Polyangia bacterium]